MISGSERRLEDGTIRLEDLDFCKSRIYKKRKKNKRVSENRRDNIQDVVTKAPRVNPVDDGDDDVNG